MHIDRLIRKRFQGLKAVYAGGSRRCVPPGSELADSSILVEVKGLENTTFCSPAPYAETVAAFRRAVFAVGLRIPMEMDVAGEIRNELGIGLRSCCVLCVASPYLLLQAAVWDGSGASFLPVRIVFAGRGTRTTIRFAGPLDLNLPAGLRGAFVRFLSRIVCILEHIGARRMEFPAAR